MKLAASAVHLEKNPGPRRHPLRLAEQHTLFIPEVLE